MPRAGAGTTEYVLSSTNTPESGLTARRRSLASTLMPGAASATALCANRSPGPSISRPCSPARNMDDVDGTRSRRSAMRRPLMMPADRSARLSSVCSRIWRDGGSATVPGSSVNSASVPSKSIRMIGRASWGRACQAANDALNSTHGTSHPALRASSLIVTAAWIKPTCV